MLNYQNIIRTVVQTTGFMPKKLLQGNLQNNPFPVTTTNKRPFYKQQTMLYEGFYQQQPSVLKIVIQPKDSLMRFRREIYAYSKLIKKHPFLANHFPKLLTYANTPAPYLIMEKLEGKNCGDWFKLNSLKISDLRTIIKLLVYFHIHVSVSHRYSYKNRCLSLKKYFPLSKKNKHKTLRLLPLPIRGNVDNLLRTRQKVAKKEWQNLKFGFVFNDFSPSNIFFYSDSIKFIDLETIGNGPLSYDLSLFCFAALGTTMEKQVISLCQQTAKSMSEQAIFDYMLVLQLLTHTYKLKLADQFKYQQLLKYLSQLK